MPSIESQFQAVSAWSDKGSAGGSVVVAFPTCERTATIAPNVFTYKVALLDPKVVALRETTPYVWLGVDPNPVHTDPVDKGRC
jgi:hypothetical protein